MTVGRDSCILQADQTRPKDDACFARIFARATSEGMGFRQGAVLFAACFFLGACRRAVGGAGLTMDRRGICQLQHRLQAALRAAHGPDVRGRVRVLLDVLQCAHRRAGACAVAVAVAGLMRRSQALLHSMVGVGLIGLIGKLHVWDESAMFFDGTSMGAHTSRYLPAF